MSPKAFHDMNSMRLKIQAQRKAARKGKQISASRQNSGFALHEDFTKVVSLGSDNLSQNMYVSKNFVFFFFFFGNSVSSLLFDLDYRHSNKTEVVEVDDRSQVCTSTGIFLGARSVFASTHFVLKVLIGCVLTM